MKYTVDKIYMGQSIPLEVQVSFVLSYRDWCLLKETDAWRQVAVFDPDAQKEEVP